MNCFGCTLYIYAGFLDTIEKYRQSIYHSILLSNKFMIRVKLLHIKLMDGLLSIMLTASAAASRTELWIAIMILRLSTIIFLFNVWRVFLTSTTLIRRVAYHLVTEASEPHPRDALKTTLTKKNFADKTKLVKTILGSLRQAVVESLHLIKRSREARPSACDVTLLFGSWNYVTVGMDNILAIFSIVSRKPTLSID